MNSFMPKPLMPKPFLRKQFIPKPCLAVITIICLMWAIISVQSGVACTSVVLNKTAGIVVSGRTMDFDTPLNCRIAFHAKGTQTLDPNAKFTRAKCQPLSWKSKYDCVLIDALNLQAYADGMNSEGLAVATLWQEDTQPSQNLTSPGRGLANISVVQYVLENAKTVEEAKDLLNGLDIFLSNYGGTDFLLHWIVTDRQGRSLVVELKDGKPVFFPEVTNLGVMTNAPAYDKQVCNLASENNRRATQRDYVLPGDYKPASRFVKAAYLLSTTPQMKDADHAMVTALQILHNVEVPKGAQQSGSFTQWITVRDQSNLRYWFVTPAQLAPIVVDLKRMDFEKASKCLLPIESTPAGDVASLIQNKSLAAVSAAPSN